MTTVQKWITELDKQNRAIEAVETCEDRGYKCCEDLLPAEHLAAYGYCDDFNNEAIADNPLAFDKIAAAIAALHTKDTLRSICHEQVVAALREVKNQSAARIAELEAALKACGQIVEDMRVEYRLHGQITDASSQWLNKVNPLVARALNSSIEEER